MWERNKCSRKLASIVNSHHRISSCGRGDVTHVVGTTRRAGARKRWMRWVRRDIGGQHHPTSPFHDVSRRVISTKDVVQASVGADRRGAGERWDG